MKDLNRYLRLVSMALAATLLLALGVAKISLEPALPAAGEHTPTATDAPTVTPTPTFTPFPTAQVPGATAIPFPAPTPGPTTTPFPTALPNPRFGIAWSSSFYNSQRVSLPTSMAIEAGAVWDRWPIPWPMVELNADGHFHWAYEDINFFLAATQDKPRWFDPASRDPSLNILAVLTGIPDDYMLVYENSDPSILGLDEPVFLTESGSPPGKINPENRWGHFVYQATVTFGGAVDAWEIGNEGDFPLSVAEHVKVMRVACRVIAVTDPTAMVLLGAPEHLVALETAQGGDTTYRALLMTLATTSQEDESLRDCIDALAFHIYERPDHSSYIVSRIADLTTLLGWRPSIWITETGVQHPDRDDPERIAPQECRETSFPCVSDDVQASYLIQQYALAAQAFAHEQQDGLIIYHRLKDEFDRDPRPEVNDGPWGLVDFDNVPLPAYHAACLVSTHLRSANYLREDDVAEPTYRHLLFVDQPQRLVHVLWATTAQEVTVNFTPRSRQFTCYQQSGALCSNEVWSGGDTFTLTLPGATTEELGHPSDPFYPAPIVGGQTFLLEEK